MTGLITFAMVMVQTTTLHGQKINVVPAAVSGIALRNVSSFKGVANMQYLLTTINLNTGDEYYPDKKFETTEELQDYVKKNFDVQTISSVVIVMLYNNK